MSGQLRKRGRSLIRSLDADKELLINSFLGRVKREGRMNRDVETFQAVVQRSLALLLRLQLAVA